ncbi:MAG: nitrilase-related carbon-nitrogen hydrolase, partial [Coriobacteriaceae bacterium]|nr:nitrilase-related carbon-nitrogen hydrolase [Coriobacteriaceae bacterium]
MSGTKLRVAIAQMEVVAGQPRKNLETMKRFVDQAKRQQADLVVFPEFCLSGRYLGNRWHDAAFIGDIASF